MHLHICTELHSAPVTATYCFLWLVHVLFSAVSLCGWAVSFLILILILSFLFAIRGFCRSYSRHITSHSMFMILPPSELHACRRRSLAPDAGMYMLFIYIDCIDWSWASDQMRRRIRRKQKEKESDRVQLATGQIVPNGLHARRSPHFNVSRSHVKEYGELVQS